MKKKNKLILASSIGIFLVIGSLVTALVLSSALATGTSSNAAANGSSGSGAIVIAWNKELLKIVKTPGAQPATIHPTRSYRHPARGDLRRRRLHHPGRPCLCLLGKRSAQRAGRRSSSHGRS